MVEKQILLHRGPKIVSKMIPDWFKTVLKLIQNGPKWSPPSPSPSLAAAKVTCQEDKQIKEKQMFEDFLWLLWKIKKYPPEDLKKGPREKYNHRVPAGVQK